MTTVACWDEYSYEDQQKIIEENMLTETIGNYLGATITIQVAWGTTMIYIDPKRNTPGCKSFLLSYLLQKAGLTMIRVSRQQYNLITTEDYTYSEVVEALKELHEHPEWKQEFNNQYAGNKNLIRFTYKMTKEELRNYM